MLHRLIVRKIEIDLNSLLIMEQYISILDKQFPKAKICQKCNQIIAKTINLKEKYLMKVEF